MFYVTMLMSSSIFLVVSSKKPAEKPAKQLTCLRHALVLIYRSESPLEPTA